MSRYSLLKAALAYLTAEWLACEDFAEVDEDTGESNMPSARDIRACRASQMREECFNAFDLPESP